jgi:Mor family transcriptional regulator
MVKKADPATSTTTTHFTPPEIPVCDDIVEYTLRCVLAMAPGLTEAIRQSIQVQASSHVREVFGGDRVYISRRAGEGTSQRNAAIKRDYLAGEHFHLMERRYGLSRARLWQIIKG